MKWGVFNGELRFVEGFNSYDEAFKASCANEDLHVSECCPEHQEEERMCCGLCESTDRFVVTYMVIAGITADTSHQRTYATEAEAKSHATDIAGYEGVHNVRINGELWLPVHM